MRTGSGNFRCSADTALDVESAVMGNIVIWSSFIPVFFSSELNPLSADTYSRAVTEFDEGRKPIIKKGRGGKRFPVQSLLSFSPYRNPVQVLCAPQRGWMEIYFINKRKRALSEILLRNEHVYFRSTLAYQSIKNHS